MLQNYEIRVFKNPQEMPNGRYRFERFLFNEPAHLQSQASGLVFVTFLWENTTEHFFDARLSVFFEGQKAVSPLKATFGGIEANPTMTTEKLKVFLNQVIDYLQKQGIKELQLTQYPMFLALKVSALIEQLLLDTGFEILYEELNHYWLLEKKTFWQNLRKGEKYVLNKAKKSGLLAQRVLSPNIEKLHALLAKARTRKGFPITLTATQLSRLFELFPDNFMAYTAYFEYQLAAMAILVQLNAEVWYVFYLADDESFLNYSPTVLLLEKIYDDALENNIQRIDMGISTVRGQRNEGLIRFKRNLGCSESVKKVFWKKLAD